MSLNKILQALEAEAAAELAEIERAAEVEIARVRAEGRGKRAPAAQQRHTPAIEAPLQAERARILNQAKLESLQTVMGTREELMRAALEAAAARLAILPDGETYERALVTPPRRTDPCGAVGGGSLFHGGRQALRCVMRVTKARSRLSTHRCSPSLSPNAVSRLADEPFERAFIRLAVRQDSQAGGRSFQRRSHQLLARPHHGL